VKNVAITPGTQQQLFALGYTQDCNTNVVDYSSMLKIDLDVVTIRCSANTIFYILDGDSCSDRNSCLASGFCGPDFLANIETSGGNWFQFVPATSLSYSPEDVVRYNVARNGISDGSTPFTFTQTLSADRPLVVNTISDTCTGLPTSGPVYEYDIGSRTLHESGRGKRTIPSSLWERRLEEEDPATPTPTPVADPKFEPTPIPVEADPTFESTPVPVVVDPTIESTPAPVVADPKIESTPAPVVADATFEATPTVPDADPNVVVSPTFRPTPNPIAAPTLRPTQTSDAIIGESDNGPFLICEEGSIGSFYVFAVSDDLRCLGAGRCTVTAEDPTGKGSNYFAINAYKILVYWVEGGAVA
jgi:hypothetical protein